MNKEELEKSLERIQGWIKAADQKIGILLAFEGVLVSVLFKDVYRWLVDNVDATTCDVRIFLLGSAGFLLYGAVNLAFALTPKSSNHQNGSSLTYFGDIADSKLSDYKKAIKDMTPVEYVDELIAQTHINSKISASKHLQFRAGMVGLVWGGLLLVAAYLLQSAN